tara:strand:+ start:165 stop:428 length:264 start_codon:yes stop_codon:yes gene_type:complete
MHIIEIKIINTLCPLLRKGKANIKKFRGDANLDTTLKYLVSFKKIKKIIPNIITIGNILSITNLNITKFFSNLIPINIVKHIKIEGK